MFSLGARIIYKWWYMRSILATRCDNFDIIIFPNRQTFIGHMTIPIGTILYHLYTGTQYIE